MSGKKQAILNFFKRNAYYLVIGVALIITAILIAVMLFTRNSSPTYEDRLAAESTPTAEVSSESEKTSAPTEKEPESDGENETPADARIIFTVPVKEANVSKEYTSSTVVYNKTLGVYTGHMGMDFSADAGTEVVAAYAGTIESITTSYLRGTTVTINHGNGLKSVYNSIEALDSLAEGQNVAAGQKIGTVSDNNRQEYKDGPHLHFEVTLNGNKVNPETYLMIKEK